MNQQKFGQQQQPKVTLRQLLQVPHNIKDPHLLEIFDPEFVKSRICLELPRLVDRGMVAATKEEAKLLRKIHYAREERAQKLSQKYALRSNSSLGSLITQNGYGTPTIAEEDETGEEEQSGQENGAPAGVGEGQGDKQQHCVTEAWEAGNGSFSWSEDELPTLEGEGGEAAVSEPDPVPAVWAYVKGEWQDIMPYIRAVEEIVRMLADLKISD